jgi:hypothetical protein
VISNAWVTESAFAAYHPTVRRGAKSGFRAAAHMYLARRHTHLDHLSYHHGPPVAHGTEVEKATGHRPDQSHPAVRARDQSPDLGHPVVLRATSRRRPVRPVHALFGHGAPSLRVEYGLLLLLFLLRSMKLGVSKSPQKLQGTRTSYLFLYKLQFLRLEQLLRHALRARLGAEEELPKLLAECRRVLVEKSGKLDL